MTSATPGRAKAKKARRLSYDERAKMESLEHLLFGDGASALAGLGGETAAADAAAAAGDAPFFVDDRPATRAATAAGTTTAAAWHDPYVETAVVDVAGGARRARKLRRGEGETDLTGGDYEARLRSRYAATHARAGGWAAAARAAAAEAGGAAAASGARLVADPSTAPVAVGAPAAAALPSGRLEVSRLADVPGGGDAVLRSVDFHPGGQLLLAAGMDGRVRFAAPDGVDNPVLQSIFLRDMQVRQAGFARGGRVAVAAGRRRFLYLFDLGAARADRLAPPCGRPERSFEAFAACPADGGDTLALLGDRGALPLLSLRTGCAAGELRLAGTARAAAFDASGTYLYAGGGDGVLHTFDLRTRRCVARVADDGGLGIASIAASGDAGAGMLAVGSGSGVVNVYERGSGGSLGPRAAVAAAGAAAAPTAPRPPSRAPPARTLLNLTTAVDTLAWSPRGEVLVAASRMARDALRAVSGRDLTVYSNWPSSRTPLGHVHCAALSPGGGLLAFGNAKGRCLLYRVHHLPI